MEKHAAFCNMLVMCYVKFTATYRFYMKIILYLCLPVKAIILLPHVLQHQHLEDFKSELLCNLCLCNERYVCMYVRICKKQYVRLVLNKNTLGI